MKPNNPQRSKSTSESKSNPEFMAQQLRQPSGNFAPEIGQKMSQVNEPLYDLTFDVMNLEKNDRLLEIGFGTGKFFNQLFSSENEMQIKAIDFSEAMVEEARQRNQDTISSGQLEIKLGSSEAIPFPDQSFNTVFSNMVVYFWDEPEVHLNEVLRVLKPGGIFYTGMRTRERMLVFPFVEYGFNLYTTKEWEKVLNRNGFKVKETHKRLDPPLDLEGNKLTLESCCIVAEKKTS